MDDTSNQVYLLKTLEMELKSLRPNAKVYKQQQNSDVFFLEKKSQLLAETRESLKSLQKGNNSNSAALKMSVLG
ncbi:ASNSD1 upstream open reading frame protein-like [Tubulanus polymorphus]|uniref:ASNSD1 upstream open reading frame protein-like n=1 Tax=Tubulanus polymorphus TaxID=672921 RepID=UPI003DA6A7F9